MSLRTESPSTPLTSQSGSRPHVGARAWSAGLCAALLVGCGATEPPEPAAWSVTVLAQGGPLHATNGMYFGPDGRLHVVSASSAEVLAVDPESGEVLERWGPEDGVQGPDDIIFGPDGSWYWTEFAFGDVAKARARRDRHRDRLARPRREPHHVLGRRPAVRVAVRARRPPLRARSGRRRGAAPHHRPARPGLRPQRHGLGPGRPAVRSAAVRQRGGAGRRRSRHVRDGLLGIRTVRSRSSSTRSTGCTCSTAGRARCSGSISRPGTGSWSAGPGPAATTWPSMRTTGSSCRATPTASSSRCSDPRRTGRSSRAASASRAAWPGCRRRMAAGGCFSPTGGRCGSWIPSPARRSTW